MPPNRNENDVVYDSLNCGVRERSPAKVDATEDSDVAESHNNHHHHHHHHHHDDDYTYTLSVSQMIKDLYTLDWSKVLWDMVFFLTIFHILAGIGFYHVIIYSKVYSVIFITITSIGAGLGITMGVHRLWTHRAFEANIIVRTGLMMLNSLAFQESIFLWAQNHRVHHKWSDTDKDFTNSRRGFFFAHMGWKMYQTHPEVIKGRKMIDCSDLLADPVVKLQHDYYYWVSLPIAFILPTWIPWYFWNEDLVVAFTACVCFRLFITFHSTWCINSVAHLYGFKPYDVALYAFENGYLGPFALGEGWHNYHHAFPTDYRASELNSWGLNLTTNVIESLNKIGWTWNLKTVSNDRVDKRTTRTGIEEMRKEALANPPTEGKYLLIGIIVFMSTVPLVRSAFYYFTQSDFSVQ